MATTAEVYNLMVFADIPVEDQRLEIMNLESKAQEKVETKQEACSNPENSSQWNAGTNWKSGYQQKVLSLSGALPNLPIVKYLTEVKSRQGKLPQTSGVVSTWLCFRETLSPKSLSCRVEVVAATPTGQTRTWRRAIGRKAVQLVKAILGRSIKLIVGTRLMSTGPYLTMITQCKRQIQPEGDSEVGEQLQAALQSWQRSGYRQEDATEAVMDLLPVTVSSTDLDQPNFTEANELGTSIDEPTLPDNSINRPEQPANGRAEIGDQNSPRITILLGQTHTTSPTIVPRPLPPGNGSDDIDAGTEVVPQWETNATVPYEASTPRPVRLLSQFGIIAFGTPVELLNHLIRVLSGYFSRGLAYDQILTNPTLDGQAVPVAFQPPFSQELDNLKNMFASRKAIHRRQVGIGLLTDFSKAMEDCVLQMSAPVTDSHVLGPLPFLDELVQALSDKSVSVFQIEFAFPISEDEMLTLLLLLAKVVSESVVDSGLLGSLECEDQSVILHESSAYLTSDNHTFECLLKIFLEQSMGFCVIASPSQKRVVDIVDTFLNDVPRRFHSKFISQSCKIVELFRQLSPSVVAIEEDSGVVTSGPYITPPFPSPVVPIPQAGSELSSFTCSYGNSEVAVAQACEETGSSELVQACKSLQFT